MDVERFAAWQAARELTAEIYRATRNGPFRSDATLRVETRDRAVTIMSSLASLYEQQNLEDVRQHLAEASMCARELHSLLFIILDAGFLASPAVNRLRALLTGVAREVSQARWALERFDALEDEGRQ
jgi:four helix bundle protein